MDDLKTLAYYGIASVVGMYALTKALSGPNVRNSAVFAS
jgi:hypothetical protein